MLCLVGYGVLRNTLPRRHPKGLDESDSPHRLIFVGSIVAFLWVEGYNLILKFSVGVWEMRTDPMMAMSVLLFVTYRVLDDISYLRAVPRADIETFYGIELNGETK